MNSVYKPLLCLLTAAFLFASAETGAEEYGACSGSTCFEESRRLPEEQLRLSGVSRRDAFWIPVYSIALYLSENPPGVRSGVPEGAKSVVLEYHRPVEKEKIVESIQDNMNKNPSVDPHRLQSKFEILTEALEPPVKGDRYEFDYVPGKGTVVAKSGRRLAVIPGDDFAFAFFGIWLSEHTGDQERRRELLENAPAGLAR